MRNSNIQAMSRQVENCLCWQMFGGKLLWKYCWWERFGGKFWWKIFGGNATFDILEPPASQKYSIPCDCIENDFWDVQAYLAPTPVPSFVRLMAIYLARDQKKDNPIITLCAPIDLPENLHCFGTFRSQGWRD